MVTTATHETFRMILNYNYTTPITKTYDYMVLYNTALNNGIKIVAILEDGVVYKNITNYDI